MFCPVCRAEYRPGFTQCADCGAKLVSALPNGDDSADSATLAAPDASAVLWAGNDPRTNGAIIRALSQAGIDYDNASLPRVLLPAVRDQLYEIRVRQSDLDAAKRAVSDRWNGALDPDEDGDETPSAVLSRVCAMVNPFHFDHPVFNHVPNEVEGQSGADKDGDPVPDDYVEDFDPVEATMLVWSGGDSQMAQIFKDCLSNVGIGCVLNSTQGEVQVLVMPSAEKRAREVVREIEEGTPMH